MNQRNIECILQFSSTIIATLKVEFVKATEDTASHYFSQQARAIDLLAATKVEIRKKTASSLSRRPKENTKRPIYL